MTEKRFEYIHEKGYEDYIYDVDDNRMMWDLECICELLNKQDGENEQLHKENQQLKTQNQRLKEGILWLLEILCKKDPESDIEFLCQTFFDCNYQTAKEKYGTLSKIMKIE